MHAVEQIFKFINGKWHEMPKSIQVGTYVMLLGCYVYLLLAPQYIDGKVVGVIPGTGQEYAIQHEIFELVIDGRAIRFVTNGRGRFAIPKPGKFPLTGVELIFFPNGTAVGSPEVPVSISPLDALFGELKVIRAGDGFMIAHSNSEFTLPHFFVNAALAQDQPIAPSQPVRNTSRLAAKKNALLLIEQKATLAIVDSSTRLDGVGIGNKDLSSILSQIEKKENVVLNTDRHSIQTVNDIIRVLDEQKKSKDWDAIVVSQWVKEKGIFSEHYFLPIENTNLVIKPIKILKDSAKIEIFQQNSKTNTPIFVGNIYTGERVILQNNGSHYSFELEKIEQAGFDRFFNPNAAFFTVKKQ